MEPSLATDQVEDLPEDIFTKPLSLTEGLSSRSLGYIHIMTDFVCIDDKIKARSTLIHY